MFYTFQKFCTHRRIVASKIDNPYNSCLNHCLRTHQTRKTCYISCTTFCLCSSWFNYCVFFSMNTETLIKSYSLRSVIITASTSTLITVSTSERSPVIASCNYSEIIDKYCTYCSLHAVGSCCDHFSKPKEVFIPLRS